MFLNRLNILEAKIHTWANGIALDTFKVEDATLEMERRLQQFQKDLASVLERSDCPQRSPRPAKRVKRDPEKGDPRVPAEVKINNQDSDFLPSSRSPGRIGWESFTRSLKP